MEARFVQVEWKHEGFGTFIKIVCVLICVHVLPKPAGNVGIYTDDVRFVQVAKNGSLSERLFAMGSPSVSSDGYIFVYVCTHYIRTCVCTYACVCTCVPYIRMCVCMYLCIKRVFAMGSSCNSGEWP